MVATAVGAITLVGVAGGSTKVAVGGDGSVGGEKVGVEVDGWEVNVAVILGG